MAQLSSGGGIGRFWIWRPAAIAGMDFTVEPILLVGKGSPRRLHPLVAMEGRFVGCGFGKMRAVLGVVAEDLRLLHGVLTSVVRKAMPPRRDYNEVPMNDWQGLMEPTFDTLSQDRDFGRAAFRGMSNILINARELHASLGDFPGSNDRLISCRLAMRNEMNAGDAIVVAEDHLVAMTVRYVLPRGAQN